MNIVLLFVTLSLKAFALDCSLVSQTGLGREVLRELERNPVNCHPHDVHLTFDDGPHREYTSVLKSELSRRNVKATFFVSTSNLDPGNQHHKRHREIVRELLEDGHLIASHGHNHDSYDLRMNGSGTIISSGMSDIERENEIKRSVDLLNWSTGGGFSQQSAQLFRFPYGRGAMPSERELREMERTGILRLRGSSYSEKLREYRRISPSLQVTSGAGFSHLGWNHDSNDSSLSGEVTGVRLRSYIVDNLRSLCASRSPLQVALFHDIKSFNREAIPVILDIGKCLGLKFIGPEEMLRKSDNLVSSGVLIPKNDSLSGPINALTEILNDNHGAPPGEDCLEEARQRTCFSEYTRRNYSHCEGISSICFEGRWYSAQDPHVASCKDP